MILAFLAPMFWALVNIIDVYFVGGIYEDAFDGVIISGLFQIIPVVGILFVKIYQAKTIFFFNYLNPSSVWLLVGGVCFCLAFYFYFKALFSHIDGALLQIIWSLNVIVVPILSLLFFKEYLPMRSYLGMIVALAGLSLVLLCKNIKLKISWEYFKIMLSAVILYSLSMIFESQGYRVLSQGQVLEDSLFSSGFICFAFGAFLASVFLMILRKRNPWGLIKKNWPWFLLLEGITFLGNLFSQRSISLAPSASYIATIETFVPIFILIFSIFILLFFKFFSSKKQDDKINLIYQEQLVGAHYKILATIVMAFGVYLIS